jgi:hypothetical protein
MGYRGEGRTYFRYAVATDAGTAFDNLTCTSGPGNVRLGVDADGYPSPKPIDGAKGTTLARPGSVDLSILAEGDLNGDGTLCLYGATDESKEPKPRISGGTICGEDEF